MFLLATKQIEIASLQLREEHFTQLKLGSINPVVRTEVGCAVAVFLSARCGKAKRPLWRYYHLAPVSGYEGSPQFCHLSLTMIAPGHSRRATLHGAGIAEHPKQTWVFYSKPRKGCLGGGLCLPKEMKKNQQNNNTNTTTNKKPNQQIKPQTNNQKIQTNQPTNKQQQETPIFLQLRTDLVGSIPSYGEINLTDMEYL